MEFLLSFVPYSSVVLHGAKHSSYSPNLIAPGRARNSDAKREAWGKSATVAGREINCIDWAGGQ